MKKKDVPQDESSLQSSNNKELCYVVDENGNYTTAKSSGWEPKTIALNNTLQDIESRVEAARLRVIQKVSSPIEYYMELHKMDVTILSGYVGLWQWRVKRHMKPKAFSKLSEKTLQKYADVFEISIQELKQVPNGN